MRLEESVFHRPNLLRVRREFDEVGLAASVVGTSSRKVHELVRLVEPLIVAIEGDRPEIDAVRGALVRAVHNLKRSKTDRSAGAAMWQVRDAISALDTVVHKLGLATQDNEWNLGRLVISNAWGYRRNETKRVEAEMRRTVEGLGQVGLFRRLVYGTVVVAPAASRASAAWYDRSNDSFGVDPEWATEPQILEAFAARLWYHWFGSGDRATWPSKESFAMAFAHYVLGRRLSGDERARIDVTVSKFAHGTVPFVA